MEALRPMSAVQRFLKSNLPWDICIAIGASGAGSLTAYRFFTHNLPMIAAGWAAVAVTAIVVLATLGKAVKRFRGELKAADPHALTGVIHAIHSTLAVGPGKRFDNPDLRICVFAPDPNDSTSVIQVTDYAGPKNPHGRNRRLSCSCGIVGKAIRSGDKLFDKLPANTGLIDHLVHEYGFERETAKAMRDDRRSWAAIPVGPQDNVVAVIFCDSKERGFFGNSNSPRRLVLESAVLGVAEYVAGP